MAGIVTGGPDDPGGSRDPTLPPIDLPQVPSGAPDGRQPLRLTVRPKPLRVAANDDGWAAGLPDFKPASSAKSGAAPADDGWAAGLPDHSSETEKAMKHAYEMGQ